MTDSTATRRQNRRKGWETRRRRAAEDAARPRVALVQNVDGRYYNGGWGFTVFWNATQFQVLPIELATRACERLATRGVSAKVVAL